MSGFSYSALLAGTALLVAFATGPVPSAKAQEPTPDEAPRYSGGHLYIPSTIVPDPFISTTLVTTTGFGKAVNLVVPVYDVNGAKVGEISSDIGYMQLGFDYQQAINRRVAVRIGGNGSARIGTSAPSILAEGISALYGYDLGASVNLWKKPAWQLTATADLRGNTLYGVSPLDFVRSVVKSVAAGDTAGAIEGAQDSLLTSGDNLRVVGGLRGAYAPAAWIGFTAFIESGLGEKFQKGTSNTTVTNVGVTASIDFNTLWHVPVGLLGVFRHESLGEKTDDIGSARDTGLGIFYTGRRFFSVGLENTWSQISQARTAEKIDVAQARIVVRYDIN